MGIIGSRAGIARLSHDPSHDTYRLRRPSYLDYWRRTARVDDLAPPDPTTTRMKHVLQFKITLQNIKPPIWRRIVVPEDCTFWDLHVAIQSAMDGWLDYHLHLFTVKHPFTRQRVKIGIPDEYGENDFLPGWRTRITAFFGLTQKRARYDYDFGDGWQHDILLEAIMPAEKGVAYPRCTAGRRQCPPEDCGGASGYARFLEAMSDSGHPEHSEYMTWFGQPFDPAEFRPSQVAFADPDRRWKYSFPENEGGVMESDLVMPSRARK